MKSKLEIYALAVCFASVVCLIISSGVAGYAVFRVVAPDITMSSYTYERHQSNEAYFSAKRSCEKESESQKNPTQDELTKERISAFERELKEEKRDGIQNILSCFMFIFTSSIALIIHARIAKKSSEA